MEFFPDGHHVQLRSRARGRYLYADEDGVGVSLRRRGAARATLNSAWRVQRLVRFGVTYVLLQSAAYGRYLALSPRQAPAGHRGRRSVQRNYDPQDLDSVMWVAVAAAEGGEAGDAAVRHITDRFLRANGRYCVWHTGVSVEDCDNRSDMTHWMVEAIPPRPAPPPFLPAAPSDHVTWQRTIRFVRANDLGNYGNQRWRTFQFFGRSVFNLRTELGVQTAAEDPSDITLCVRPGFFGRLTPLVTNLPRSQEAMDIVVLTTASQAAQGLRHPDVDAA